MVVKESISRDLLRLFVWYPVRWLILILPAPAGIAILRAMGDIHSALSKGKKEVLGANLKRIDPAVTPEKTRYVIKEYFRNHYIDRLLIFICPGFQKGEVKSLLSIKGIERLDSAIKKGKGVILVHGHFGPVHIPLVALSRLGYRMKQIGLPSDEGLSWIGRNVAFRLRLKYESMMPAEIIKADGFLRGAFRWLGENGVIMITGDGSGTEKKVGKHQTFQYCGNSVDFPVGPALLAAKTGAEILPMFITPGEGSFLYNIIIEEAITNAGEPLDITGKFVGRLESYVRKYPWYMHFLDKFTPGLIINRQ
ncbi:MAG: lysophospholipid acyltransferase family protein [Deltaproteobacteria bacterium]|nr:lysophospholipid acyltransferase family protein [Deltaproteobacteria bacterium]